MEEPLKAPFLYTILQTVPFMNIMFIRLFKCLCLFSFFVVCATESISQTLEFYGGAGITGDRFSFDKELTDQPASLTANPIGLIGLRYKTLQNFDIFLDATIGISSIKVSGTEELSGHIRYQQLQSLLMLGAGLNISTQQSTLIPFMQIGGCFFDYWDLVLRNNSGEYALSSKNDYNTNRWTVVCGAGIGYQFRFLLASELNVRLLYTPLDVFDEPAVVTMTSSQQSTQEIKLQGKLLQAQLTYRVCLPIKKWNDRY